MIHGGDITVHFRFKRRWKPNSRGGNWIEEAQTAWVLGCQHGVVLYAFIYGLVNVEKWKSDGYFSVKRPGILLIDPKDIWSFSRLQNWVCKVRHSQVRCYSNLSEQAYVSTAIRTPTEIGQICLWSSSMFSLNLFDIFRRRKFFDDVPSMWPASVYLSCIAPWQLNFIERSGPHNGSVYWTSYAMYNACTS